MIEEINEYLVILKDIQSPVYLIVLFTVFLGMIVYQIFKTIIIPKNRLHQQEKDALLSLFAQLDPDPLIRFDREGTVIIANDSASDIFRTSFNSTKVQKLFRNIKITPDEIINKNMPLVFSERIDDKEYLVTVKPVPSLGVAQLYFQDVTENAQNEKKLLEYQRRLKDYNQNLDSLIEEEKFRIARDLHDSIGQKLLLLKMKARKELEAVGKPADEIDLSLEETIAELREIIYNLKPKILEELGLPTALNALTQKIAEESGIRGNFELSGDTERFKCKTELFLFRIVQEALNNIVKHSGADIFSVQLINSAAQVKLIVTDNGNGFNSENLFNNTSRMTGFGLFNIKEKVESNSGTFRINSSPGEGTILMVILEKRNL